MSADYNFHDLYFRVRASLVFTTEKKKSAFSETFLQSLRRKVGDKNGSKRKIQPLSRQQKWRIIFISSWQGLLWWANASKKVFILTRSHDDFHSFSKECVRNCWRTNWKGHRGSILASHPAAPGLNLGTAEIFSRYCLVGGQYWDQTHLVPSNGFHKCS